MLQAVMQKVLTDKRNECIFLIKDELLEKYHTI